MARLRIGSRGSQLALWQAHHISDLLRARGHTVELEIIKTTGDKITDVALAKVGTKGMFTKEIEEGLVENRVDLAVHSLKDLPTELPADFEIAAITTRENPRDVFCSVKFSSIEALPQRASVGTSSLRRQAQLKALRPDLQIHPLRGNVDTRLHKLESGDHDAIILAAAGLNRLGKTQLVRQVIPAEVMTPAAGQGALAIEIRHGDTATRTLLAFLDDAAARATTTCERAPARATILCVWVKKLGRLFSDAAAILFSKKFTAKGSLCRNSREDRPFRFGAGPQTAGPSLRSGCVGNGEMIFDN